MDADQTELKNLTETHPEKFAEMSQTWQAWADRVGVYPKAVSKGKKSNAKKAGRRKRHKEVSRPPDKSVPADSDYEVRLENR